MSGHPARAGRTALEVSAAGFGSPSPLPALTPLRVLPDTEPGQGVPAEIRRRAAYGRLGSPLPYPVQDGYDRVAVPARLPAVALDNGLLRAVVLPSLGGRVWSLTDLARGRELLFVNPVLQPASFGLTGAWFAGGIEWNLGSTGHAPTSCRPVHVGVLHRPDGDVVRLWEWERTRDLVLQVDLSIPAGGDRLLASTRVLNPDPEDKPLYSWTNIAVPQTEGTRVLVEAESAWRTDYEGQLGEVSFPHPDAPDLDVSRPAASWLAADYFFDVVGREGRHIVAVEPDGHGVAQSSTAALRGRKLFLWGHGPGGHRWQEWLCGPGATYAEIQAGYCPTQLEHDVIPGHGEVAWTEAFGAVDLDPALVTGPYAEAATHARREVHAAVPPEQLEARHAAWRVDLADDPVDEVLAVGSGWGRVEQLLRGIEPSSALPFPEVDDDSVPAAALVVGDWDRFEQTADRLPVPPVSDRWAAVLTAAGAQLGPHWWLDHARAVRHHSSGDREAAEAAYSRSVEARPTVPAIRGLALLAADRGDPESAAEHFEWARSLDPTCRPLVTEQLDLLLAAGRPEACLAVIETSPRSVRDHGRTRLQQARALAAAGSRDAAAALLVDLEVEDLAEGDRSIGDLWRDLHPGSTVPERLDFRMSP
ncbi:DUF5107 domain-containing protein [Nocardioides sp.]|uniref:DUF5107 domain-containing protein n=1 Tax=Nocardioides sp. TaxID=35761 RepID=UPI002ED15A1C